MRSTTAAASALAFAVSAMAQVPGFAVLSAPAEGETVVAGTTYNIKWDAGAFNIPVVISILGGASPTTLQPGAQIAGKTVPTSPNDLPRLRRANVNHSWYPRHCQHVRLER